MIAELLEQVLDGFIATSPDAVARLAAIDIAVSRATRAMAIANESSNAEALRLACYADDELRHALIEAERYVDAGGFDHRPALRSARAATQIQIVNLTSGMKCEGHA